MTDIRKRLRLSWNEANRIIRGRSLWLCLLAVSLCGTMMFVSTHTKMVYIRDAGTTIVRYTLKHEPAHILSENGITTMAFDVVDFTGFEGKLGVINIDRAFPISILVDGQLHNLMSTEITVRELLEQQRIKLGPDDIINLSPSFYLSPNDSIVIKRVDEKDFREEESIAFKTVYKDTPLLSPGQITVLQAGSDGKKVTTYADVIVDGKLTEHTLIDEHIIKKPVTQEVLRGANVAVSDLDFGIPLDANGVPVSYKKLLTNQICTAYSAGDGARGASSLGLQAGSVAVRASQIPYGTKLYITSADNSFVYGFAIAADTGLGLVQNIIDIDLFYDTYAESCLNGRKHLNVYIL